MAEAKITEMTNEELDQTIKRALRKSVNDGVNLDSTLNELLDESERRQKPETRVSRTRARVLNWLYS